MFNRALATVGALIVSVLAGGVLMLLAGAVYILLLRLPLAQGPGAWQALRLIAGGGLLLLLPLAWLALVMYAFEYLSKGARFGRIAERFVLLCGIIACLLPVTMLGYELAFPSARVGLGMMLPVEGLRLDLWLAGGGLLLGPALLLVYRCLASRRGAV